MASFSHQSNARYRVLALMEVIFKALNFIFLGQDILNVKQSLFSCRAHCGQAGGAHLSRCGFVHGGQWPTWHWTWATCPRVLC